MFDILGPRKQKKALLKNAKNLKEIYEMYWEKEICHDKYRNKTIEKQYFKHNVTDILKKFNINSNNELIFLLRRFSGKVISICEFCNEEKIELNLRKTIHEKNCRHKGICITCKKPYDYGNNDNVCYTCRPHKENRDYYFQVRRLIDFVQREFEYEETKAFYIYKDELNFALNVFRDKYHILQELWDNSYGSHGRGNGNDRDASGSSEEG